MILTPPARSQYHFFTDWADKGLIADPVFSENSIIRPLRTAVFKIEPSLNEAGPLNNTKKYAMTLLFITAFIASPFVNWAQHSLASAKLIFNAPFNRSEYPQLKNDHVVAIICSGFLCFPLAPIFAILSTMGSIFKTIDLLSAVPK